MTMRKTALLASTLALVACGNRDFNKPSLLNEPRILAVKAEPPQPSAGVTTTLSTLLYQPENLKPGQCPNPVTTTSKWSWCPMPMVADSVANTFKCPFPEDSFKQLYAALGAGDPPPYELGSGETMAFTNPFPAPLLHALCRGDIGSTLSDSPDGGTSAAGSGKSVFSCDLPATDYNTQNAKDTHPIGFKITIKVEVTPACPDLLPAGFSPLIALYALHLPTDDGIPGNQNPVLSGIFATDNVTTILDGGTTAPPSESDSTDGGVASDDGGTAAALDGGQNSTDAAESLPDGSVPLEDDPVVKVNRNKHVGLRLDIAIETAEHLTVPSTIDYDSEKKLTRHYEHLDFGWYAEAGDFTGRGKGHNTGYLPTALPAGQLDDRPSQLDQDHFLFNITNTWDAPKSEDYPRTTSRIIVVVRDGRGGVAWTSKQVTLEDKP
jgi:hypothetical protein